MVNAASILIHKTGRLGRIYARALKIAFDAGPRYTFFALFTSTFSAIALPAQMWIAKLVIDRVSSQLTSENIHQGVHWDQLLLPMGLYLLVWAASEFFQTVSQSVQELFVMKVEQYARSLMLRKASRLSVAFYESPAYFDKMDIAASQMWRFGNVSYFSFQLLTQAAAVVGLMVLLGNVHILLPIVLLLTTIPRLISQSTFNKRKALLSNRNASIRRLAEYFGELLSGRETVKEVRLFQLQDTLLDGFKQNTRFFIDGFARISISQERVNLLLSFISMVGTAAAWGYSIFLALAARISLGDIAMVFQSTERTRAALNQIFFYMGHMLENSLYLEHFFNFLDLPADSDSRETPERKEHEPADSLEKDLKTGAFEFCHVSFHYPGSDQEVLHDVSFTLQTGQTLALVGENGAGKTTLVKLLTRLYEPTGGKILLNGRNLRDYPLEDYYRQIGVIFQDFARYDLSVRENIGFGRTEKMQDVHSLDRAARLGGAADLIKSMPDGYDTMLGKRFGGGSDLSGGEWQKIGLSRAFMRDAALLILDEPPAALDVHAENEVYTRFAELTLGKTAVLVTHRLFSVKTAHHIIVLQAGRLIEKGTHVELIKQNGAYAKMFNLQAERYIDIH